MERSRCNGRWAQRKGKFMKLLSAGIVTNRVMLQRPRVGESARLESGGAVAYSVEMRVRGIGS